MSLSSSIEFEARSKPAYRSNADSDAAEASFVQGHSRTRLPRVRYPTPDYDQDEPPGPVAVESDHQETVVFIATTKGVPEENGFQAPFVLSATRRMSSSLSPPVESRFSPSSAATGTTSSTVPLSKRTATSIGDANSGIGTGEAEHRRGLNGASAVSSDEGEADGVMAVTESAAAAAGASEPDRFGFLGGSGKEVAVPVDVFRRRESKWLAMLGNWQFFMTKRFDKVRTRCRKGIPSSIRPRAWKYLCGAQFFMTSSKTKHIFETLDSHPGDPHWNSEILKDLNRQFPNHEMFSQATPYGKFGQEDLFRVLKAWTVLHPEEGYCQAQAPIAAALLMHMPAHEAFYCFAQICQKYLPSYYSPGLEAVQLDGDILFGLLKKHSYSSYKHLKKQNIDPVLYMVEWFMCIFCRTLPWPCVLRVLDMFFCEGVKILFKVGVFLFKYGLSSREQLNACPTMYETIERLRHLPIQNLNEEYLVQKVAEMNISDEDLERVHYKQVKARNKKQKQQRSHVTI